MARPRRRVPAVPEPDRLPWERQKKEPVTTFHQFALYRDLGPMRSLTKVAAMQNTPTINALKISSAKYGWVERAEAYDDYVDERMREERETERARLERTHFGAGAAMLGVALRRINGAPAAVSASGETIEPVERLDPNTMDAGDVARVMETAVRIQRISAGLPTDVLKGSFAITNRDAAQMASDIIEILTKFIPQERQARAYSELQAYVDSGQRL